MAVGETISAEEFRKRYSQQAPQEQEQPKKKKSLMQKLGSFGEGLGKVLGGNVIGEAIGTAIANRSSGARELENAPAITHEGREIVPAGGGKKTFQGPSGKEIAGDVLKSATTIASAALPGAGSVLGRAAQGAALGYAGDVAQGFIEGRDSFKPGIGTGFGAGLPLAGALVGNLIKRGVALTTGAGREVIDRAIHNPSAVSAAIKEYAKTDASKQGLVSRARAAIFDFLEERSDEYAKTLEKVEANTVTMKNGQQYLRRLPVGEEANIPGYKGGEALFPNDFTLKGLKDTFTRTLKDFGAKGSGRAFDFKEVALPKRDLNQLQELANRIYDWDNFTPTGLNKFRQIIDSYGTEGRSPGMDAIVSKLRSNVVKYIDPKVPLIREMNAVYAKKTQLANDVLKELNLSGNAKPTTQLNSILRLFKKDPEVIKGLEKIMGKAEADVLMNDLSGAILSEWLPIGARRQVIEGLGTLGGVYGVVTGGIPVLPAIGAAASASPRIVGEIATKTGRALEAGVGTAIQRTATQAASRLNR